MRKFIVFRLGPDDFGIEIGSVVEVIKSRKGRLLPDAGEFISGVITLRGSLIPLIDMRKRFSIEPAPKKERTLVVSAGGERVGLVVDEVKGINGFRPEDIIRPPIIFRGLKRRHLAGLGMKNGAAVMLLNMESILDSDEKIMLKEAIGGLRKSPPEKT